jgi:glycosyltransferase involved in cell wall biosynthesis
MISVVIPCYNAEPFLAEALESVMKQTRPVDEVLVVNDGSTDRSAEIARSYGAEVISIGRNSGNAAARNAGIQSARGDLIAWLDADDYWNCNHCEVVCGLLERHPDAATAYSAVRLFGSRTGVLYISPRDHEPFDGFWTCFLGNLWPPLNSAVTRRSAIIDIGGFNPQIRFAPDFDFFLRMAQHYHFVATPEITSNYRWHSAQLSSNPDKQRRSIYEARHRILQSTREQRNEQLALRMEKEMLAIWERDMRNAWRDPEELRALVALCPLIPGSTPLGPWARLRVRVPPRVVRRLDHVWARLALRRRCHGFLRRCSGAS